MIPFPSNAQPTDNSALIAEVFKPRTSWGQLMALKDRDLQYQVTLTQAEQQKALEMQQADANFQAVQAALNENDFEQPDEVRVGAWLKGQEKTLATYLKDQYQGDVAQWYKVEFPAWVHNTMTQLRKSPEYQQAVQNRLQVGLLKKARAEGQTPVGRVVQDKAGKPRYVSADEMYLEYMNGKTPSFTYLGAYKPDDDLKEMRDTFAPGVSPFVRTPVSEEEKLNFLMQKYPREIALDKYYQQHQSATVFYKSKPMDELMKFQQSQAEFRMKQQEFGMNRQLKNEQYKGLQLTNAIKATKLQELAEEKDPNGFFNKMMNVAVAETPVYFDAANGNKQLRQSGIDLNQLHNGHGAASFNAIPVYGSEDIIAQRLGLTKGKEGYTGRLSFSEGIAEQNGFHAIDLSRSKFQVVGVENKVLYNQKNPDQGFARITVRFDNESEAAKAGYLAEWLPWDWTTREGTGNYNKTTKEATLTVPMGSLSKDKNFWHSLQKNMMGRQAANASLNQVPAWAIMP